MGVYDERRVKIVATLGPASRHPETLREMMEAGLDVVRVNAAHGSPTALPAGTGTRTR